MEQQQQPYGYAGYQIPEPPAPKRDTTLRNVALLAGCGCVGLCVLCCFGPVAAFFLVGGQFVFSVDDEVSNAQAINLDGAESANLNLNLEWGDLFVRNTTASDDTTLLLANYRYNVEKYIYRVTSRRQGAVLDVTVDQPEGELVYVITDEEVISEVEVAVAPTVPTAYSIDVSSGSVGITLADSAATSLNAKTLSGETTIALTGDFPRLQGIAIEALSGAVAINHSAGLMGALETIAVETSSGDTTIVLTGNYDEPLAISIDASSGAVVVDLRTGQFEGFVSIQIEASSGDVRLVLPANSDGRTNLAADTSSGDVMLFGANVGDTAALAVSSGSAAYDINLEASDGDITIER